MDVLERKLLLVEALLCLVLARMAVTLFPFRTIRWFMSLPSRQPEVLGVRRRALRNAVRWAILRAAKCLPGTVCLPRGMAAQHMLRRRRIATTLYFGAATLPDKGLTSHVWVVDGEEGVMGLRASRGYKVIARYPEG